MKTMMEMDMFTRTIIAMGSAGGLALMAITSNFAAADESVLTGAEIKQLLIGATAYGTSSRGAPYQVRYAADGSMSLSMSGFSDSGQWSLDGDLYCAQWNKVRDGKHGCWKVIQKDSRNFEFEGVDGMDDHDIVIEK